jgi:hypothetical protein
VIEGLRRRIGRLEGFTAAQPTAAPLHHLAQDAQDAEARPITWTRPDALEVHATHEIKPLINSAGCYATALSFALGLAAERLSTRRRDSLRSPPHLLWCTTAAFAGEFGRLYGPGLMRMGLDARLFTIVETARASETLWAMEEGLKSKAVSLVIGCLDDVGLTPARRLSLAAKYHGTACLLITNARTPPAAATATRWRIGPAPSAPHIFDAKAPGNMRLAVTLERCRNTPFLPDPHCVLDWCDDTFCFRMALPWRRAG